ncbi:cystathionine beta-lyase STR3 [Ascoidea rubescens DSM 1968]|uniref:Cystathionine beta-lyase n=1 Tax=Ascoidea rubescens DSM 1968 TaxID=1344418 RepID=A0A1D2VFS4_9ASCO|nr:cystathionine beta-l [Ascoidea rubescens DSM 1968]ODV60524.1 cystathionine beta-l [Ascoidea rubescens DSM 1968]
MPSNDNYKYQTKYSIDTELLQLSSSDDPTNSSIPPLYQTTTFKQDLSPNASNQYDYTRSGNPTRSILEIQLSKIMKSYRSFVVSTGMSCLDLILKLLEPNTSILSGNDLYGGSDRLFKFYAKNLNLNLLQIDTSVFQNFVDIFNQNPDIKMVFLESPTNPLIKIIDLKKIVNFIKSNYPNCLIIFDNTMLSPLFLTPLDFGVDIHYESATKYLNGHHDIMAGVVATRDPKIADKLAFTINATGSALNPFDSWLLIRGLKTLSLRLERQQENALKLANFLDSIPNLIVHYPGLKSHPQYDLHKSYTKGFGSVLSFETGSISKSEKIVKNTNLFSVTVSFGSVNSLISMPCTLSHASIDAKTRQERHLPEDLIRVCVGIENFNDLINDLKHSLLKAGYRIPSPLDYDSLTIQAKL